MATINVSFAINAMPTPPQQADIQNAAQQWAVTLRDVVTINVEFWAVDMSGTGAGLNAMCIPGIVQDGGLTLTRPQAKLRGLIPPGAADLDLVVAFDTGTAWLYGAQQPGPGQFSLGTTMLHELCHGLGFVGLCNVDNQQQQGIYSDANLVGLMQMVVGATAPPVVVPPHFFPQPLVSGQMTPFAVLFGYANPGLQKGVPQDDYVAFTSPPGAILAQANALATYTVTTGAPFAPFTTCDHIESPPGRHYLMSPSTGGLYLAAPDAPACELLQAIGWTI